MKNLFKLLEDYQQRIYSGDLQKYAEVSLKFSVSAYVVICICLMIAILSS